MKYSGYKIVALALAVTLFAIESRASADKIFINGKIFTAESGSPLVEAVAIQEGRILKAGSTPEILALADEGTERVDLEGKVMMPGMIDTHSHPIMAGLTTLMSNLDGQELPIEKLQEFVLSEHKSGKANYHNIVLITGVSSAYFEKLQDLNRVFNRGVWADLPLVLMGSDGHTGWINRKMLNEFGIDAETVKNQTEKMRSFVGYYKDFSPNGYFAEAAWDEVRNLLPAPSEELMLKAARAALEINTKFGITALMDAAANGGLGVSMFEMRPTVDDVGLLPLYKELAVNEELNLHVAALLLAHPQSKPEDLEVHEQVMKKFSDVPNLTFPGIKVFADGIMEYPGQTAAVIDPFKNSLKQGQLLFDPKTFGDFVAAIEQRDWIIHIHAVGDRAVRESLNAIEYANNKTSKILPNSITHLQLVNPKEFERFESLGVIASMQLLWARADNYTETLVKPYVDAMAYRYQYPARSLHKAGAIIAGASDWPVSSPNPWLAISQASTRKGELGVLNKDEAIDRETMFYAYTINAAKALRLDHEIGSISSGKKADLIILDRDVFSVSDEALAETSVVSTYFNGKEIYRAE